MGAQWKNISRKFPHFYIPLDLPKTVCLKDACQRFLSIFGNESGTVNSQLDVVCCKCKGVMCDETCMSDNEELIIFDFGSKTSWFKYEGENTGQLSMHPTVSPIPGILPNIDSFCDDVQLADACPVCNRNREIRQKLINKKRVDNQVTGTATQKIDKKKFPLPFAKLSLKNFHCFDSSQLDSDETEYMSAVLIKNDGQESEHESGDSAASLDAKLDEMDKMLVEPTSRTGETTDEECLNALFFLMKHMLKRNAFHLRKNIPFVVCEPFNFNENIRQSLLCYAFEKLKVAGICFIPKAVATALYIGMDTCLVIDSGANHTTVTPVIEQEGHEESAQSRAVGGMHVARWLQQCVAMKAMKGPDFEIDVTKLDSSHLMRECWVAYNPTTEAKRKLPNKAITLKGKRNGATEYFEVELSHELFLSVEDMYTQLDIPTMINTAISDFDETTQRQLLSNIVLSGGNCRLNGLANRITRDLQAACSQHSEVIHVCDPRLMTGRTDAVVGASYVRRWEHAHWNTRKQYVYEGIH